MSITSNNEPKKFCPDCNKHLPLREFSIDLRYGTAAGLSHICTACKDKSTEQSRTSRKEMLLKKIGFKGLRATSIGKFGQHKKMTDAERKFLKSIHIHASYDEAGMRMLRRLMGQVSKLSENQTDKWIDEGYPNEPYIPGEDDNDPFKPMDDRPPDFY